MITAKREYGILEHVETKRVWIDGWTYRAFWTYRSNDPDSGLGGFPEAYVAAGPNDTSEPANMLHGMGPSDYDSRCPCCYLGHGHTVNAHKHFVQSHITATENWQNRMDRD